MSLSGTPGMSSRGSPTAAAQSSGRKAAWVALDTDKGPASDPGLPGPRRQAPSGVTGPGQELGGDR